MPSPPKPWERAGNPAVAAATSTAGSSAATSLPNASTDGDSTAPALPPRTTATGYSASRPGYSSYNTGVGTGYASYNSPYNRMGVSRFGTGYGGYGSGGYGSGVYGSGYGYGSTYSGYGSTYGGYGGSYGSTYGGYGMYGAGRPGMYGPGDPNGEPSLMHRMESSTASTFHLLESIVNAFGGFAQMLDSTYMATHSSFMAMVGVAEQFGHLRNYLGQVLSVFALVRGLRRLFYWLTGRQPPVNPNEITASEFEAHNRQNSVSRRPLYIFLAAIIGIPWLVGRLVRAADRRRRDQGDSDGPAATGAPSTDIVTSGRANDIEFARVTHDFQGDNALELSLRRGDLVAILSRLDANGQPSQWWRGRLRDGRIGLFPANYVEILEKRVGGGNNNNSGGGNGGGNNGDGGFGAAGGSSGGNNNNSLIDANDFVG